MGRYRDGTATVRPGKGKRETGHRSRHSAGPRREPRGHRRADRVSLLRAGAAHHGGGAEREWGECVVRVSRTRNLGTRNLETRKSERGTRNSNASLLQRATFHFCSAFRLPRSAFFTA